MSIQVKLAPASTFAIVVPRKQASALTRRLDLQRSTHRVNNCMTDDIGRKRVVLVTEWTLEQLTTWLDKLPSLDSYKYEPIGGYTNAATN